MYSVCCGRESRDHHLCVNSPRLFADFHALLLLTPRHPPCALDRLATEIPNSRQTQTRQSQAITLTRIVDFNLNLLTISHSRIQSNSMPKLTRRTTLESATLPFELLFKPIVLMHAVTPEIGQTPTKEWCFFRCQLPNNQIVKDQCLEPERLLRTPRDAAGEQPLDAPIDQGTNLADDREASGYSRASGER